MAMSRLFDTALPPLWYFAFWVVLFIAFRLFIVNPIVTATKDLGTELKATRDSQRKGE